MLLAQHNEVVALDIVASKVTQLNQGQSPIEDPKIQDFLTEGKINFKATSDKQQTYAGARYVIVATPTNYDTRSNYFDTSSVEAVVQDALVINPQATVVIKSTVPVGFTASLNARLFPNTVAQDTRIIFSPEFLREGHALQDCLQPSRIVVGANNTAAQQFAQLLATAPPNRTSPPCLPTARRQRPSGALPTPT